MRATNQEKQAKQNPNLLTITNHLQRRILHLAQVDQNPLSHLAPAQHHRRIPAQNRHHLQVKKVNNG